MKKWIRSIGKLKIHVDRFLAAINFAWGELFDFRWQLILKHSAPLKYDNNFTFAAFPLLGFAVGVAVSFISMAVAGIFNINAGALVFAVLAWLILCFKDSGRGDCWLANFFLGKLQPDENRDLLRNILNLFPMMFKFIILLFIGLSGEMFYFPVLLTTAFALQAALAGSEDCRNEFIPSGEEGKKYFLITLIVLGIVGIIFCRLGCVAAIAAAFGLFFVFNKKMIREGFSAAGISSAGYISEWALLAVGLLLL